MAKETSEFQNVDKQVFAIAGLLDAQLRVAGLNAGEFSELVIVEKPESEHGIATSLSVAVARGEAAGFYALIVGLAEQPGGLSSSWRRLRNSNAPIAVANYDGLAGNPVRLEKSVWPLLPRSGDEGARVLLRTRPELVKQVACEGSPDDIDTVEDLGQWS